MRRLYRKRGGSPPRRRRPMARRTASAPASSFLARSVIARL